MNTPNTHEPTDSAPAAAPGPASAAPAAPSRLRPRRTWFTVLLCLVIFFAGGVVGVGGTLLRIGHQTREALRNPARIPHRIALNLQSRLDLSEDQTARVETIVKRRQARLLAAREQLMDDVDPVMDDLEADIAQVLRPEQARQFRERFRQLREEWLPRTFQLSVQEQELEQQQAQETPPAASEAPPER